MRDLFEQIEMNAYQRTYFDLPVTGQAPLLFATFSPMPIWCKKKCCKKYKKPGKKRCKKCPEKN